MDVSLTGGSRGGIDHRLCFALQENSGREVPPARFQPLLAYLKDLEFDHAVGSIGESGLPDALSQKGLAVG